MCWGYRASEEAVLQHYAVEFRNEGTSDLVQSEHAKPAMRVTLKSHTLSLRNHWAWPGRREEHSTGGPPTCAQILWMKNSRHARLMTMGGMALLLLSGDPAKLRSTQDAMKWGPAHVYKLTVKDDCVHAGHTVHSHDILMLAMKGVFTPKKWANAVGSSFLKNNYFVNQCSSTAPGCHFRQPCAQSNYGYFWKIPQESMDEEQRAL